MCVLEVVCLMSFCISIGEPLSEVRTRVCYSFKRGRQVTAQGFPLNASAVLITTAASVTGSNSIVVYFAIRVPTTAAGVNVVSALRFARSHELFSVQYRMF